jgi:dipeptidase
MCDALVAVGGETAAGITLFGKNSDRLGDECQPLRQYAEASHPPQATVRCTHIEVPQVAETYRVLGHAPWWVWGFEHGVNEHAVAVGNLTVFSNEPIEEQPGLIGMDLVRLALERGRSAREALEVIATLLERYGQGGAALAPGGAAYHNAFVLTDAAEAWMLETSNRHWAARRAVVDSRSNHFSLVDDWEIGSRDVESFARGEGLWRNSGRVNLASAYRNRHVPGRISEGRYRRTQQLLVAGRGRHDRASFERILRDHDEGGPVWQPGATAEEERYFTVCAHSDPVSWTTASLIAPLPAAPEAPWPVWVGFGTPCSGVFLPVYVDGVIPPAYARGGPEAEEDSAWWTFVALQRAAAADTVRATPLLREGWRPFEMRVEAERELAENAARLEVAGGRPDRAAEIVSDFAQRCADEALDRARELTAQLGG